MSTTYLLLVSQMTVVISTNPSHLLPTKYVEGFLWYRGCGFKRDREAGTTGVSLAAFTESVVENFTVTIISYIPADPSTDFKPREGDEPEGSWQYRQALGSLMWLSNSTPPDIANAVRAVATL